MFKIWRQSKHIYYSLNFRGYIPTTFWTPCNNEYTNLKLYIREVIVLVVLYVKFERNMWISYRVNRVQIFYISVLLAPFGVLNNVWFVSKLGVLYDLMYIIAMQNIVTIRVILNLGVTVPGHYGPLIVDVKTWNRDIDHSGMLLDICGKCERNRFGSFRVYSVQTDGQTDRLTDI